MPPVVYSRVEVRVHCRAIGRGFEDGDCLGHGHVRSDHDFWSGAGFWIDPGFWSDAGVYWGFERACLIDMTCETWCLWMCCCASVRFRMRMTRRVCCCGPLRGPVRSLWHARTGIGFLWATCRSRVCGHICTHLSACRCQSCRNVDTECLWLEP